MNSLNSNVGQYFYASESGYIASVSIYALADTAGRQVLCLLMSSGESVLGTSTSFYATTTMTQYTVTFTPSVEVQQYGM